MNLFTAFNVSMLLFGTLLPYIRSSLEVKAQYDLFMTLRDEQLQDLRIENYFWGFGSKTIWILTVLLPTVIGLVLGVEALICFCLGEIITTLNISLYYITIGGAQKNAHGTLEALEQNMPLPGYSTLDELSPHQRKEFGPLQEEIIDAVNVG